MQAMAIDGLFNVRASTSRAPWLIRSGTTDSLTPAGTRTLRDLGVGVIVDLREPSETRDPAHDLPVVAVALYGTEPPREGKLEEVYESLLRHRGTALARAVAVVADAEEAVLVHCTAGKDRTGLVTALVLRAAGVSEDEIVADYASSGAEVRARREAHAHRVAETVARSARADTVRLHLDSPPEAILFALALIDELGGIEDYLLRHGIEPGQIAALRRKQGATG